LPGGRVTPGVVRVGDTVRRPIRGHSDYSHALLRLLEARGFDGAPRFLGIDDQDREILSFLPGEVPPDLRLFSDRQVERGAAVLRRYHDATAGSDLCAGREVVCHGDASPCNYVFVDDLPYALIDFDNARPGYRSHDVGYAAWLWLDIGNPRLDARRQGKRLSRFVGSYGSFDVSGALRSVLEAQTRSARDRSVPLFVRAWATCSREWTVKHVRLLEVGMWDLWR